MSDDVIQSTVPALSLPSVSTERFEFTRWIGCGFTTELGGYSPHATLQVELADDMPDHWDDAVLLSGKYGMIEIAQGHRLVRGLTGIDVGTESQEDVDRWSWFQAALIGRLSGTPFAGTEQLGKASLPAEDEAVILRLHLKTGEHAFSTYARAHAPTWQDFLAPAYWKRIELPSELFIHFPYQINVLAARHTMPGHAFQKLCDGDIVLPSSPQFSTDGEGWLRIGSTVLFVQYTGPSCLEITAVGKKMESQDNGTVMAEPVTDHAPPSTVDGDLPRPEASAVDMLPVTLNFELGYVRVSFGELRTAGPGVMLPLLGGSPSSVTITSGGYPLGRGEIVDVNGQLGIRIVQWGMSEK